VVQQGRVRHSFLQGLPLVVTCTVLLQIYLFRVQKTSATTVLLLVASYTNGVLCIPSTS
jgi:phosphatidylserine synthase